MPPQRGVLGLQVCYLLVFGSAVSLGLLQKLIETELTVVPLNDLVLHIFQTCFTLIELLLSLIGTLLPLGDSSRTLSQRFDFVSIGGVGFRLLLDRFKVFFLYRYDTGQDGLAGAGNLIYARLEFSQWLDLCDYGFFLLLDVSEHFITGVLVFLN